MVKEEATMTQRMRPNARTAGLMIVITSAVLTLALSTASARLRAAPLMPCCTELDELRDACYNVCETECVAATDPEACESACKTGCDTEHDNTHCVNGGGCDEYDPQEWLSLLEWCTFYWQNGYGEVNAHCIIE
jgi:hypothetical protein